MAKLVARIAPLLLVVVLLLGAACGSDDSGGGSNGDSQAAGQADDESTPEDEATPEESGPPTIVADEFSYQVPETLPAGETAFKFQNVGKQKHMAIFVELLKGKTLDDVNKYLAAHGPGGRPPSWVRLVRKAQGFAKPGATTKFSGEFTPGTYAMLCFIRDPESKKPHALLGMTAAVTFE